MAYRNLQIPEVAGEVSTEYGFWRGYRFTVNGERLKASGPWRNRLTLPGTTGPVEAKIKAGMLRAYPSLVVGDVEHRTGPATPRAQQMLAVLPLLAYLLVQGLIGIAVVLLAIVANMAVVRSGSSTALKIILMIGVFAVALVVDIGVALAINAAVGR